MSILLYLESSPRKARSKSISVASEFLDAYRTAHPDAEIDKWDLWNTPLPEFDGATIDAKYKTMHGESHSAEEASAWEEVVRIFDRFNAADKYVLSVPMWNFGIPYKLKHFIDVIVQPGLAFRFSRKAGTRGSSPASRSSSFTPGGATIPPSKARRSISRNATWKHSWDSSDSPTFEALLHSRWSGRRSKWRRWKRRRRRRLGRWGRGLIGARI